MNVFELSGLFWGLEGKKGEDILDLLSPQSADQKNITVEFANIIAYFINNVGEIQSYAVNYGGEDKEGVEKQVADQGVPELKKAEYFRFNPGSLVEYMVRVKTSEKSDVKNKETLKDVIKEKNDVIANNFLRSNIVEDGKFNYETKTERFKGQNYVGDLRIGKESFEVHRKFLYEKKELSVTQDLRDADLQQEINREAVKPQRKPFDHRADIGFKIEVEYENLRDKNKEKNNIEVIKHLNTENPDETGIDSYKYTRRDTSAYVNYEEVIKREEIMESSHPQSYKFDAGTERMKQFDYEMDVKQTADRGEYETDNVSKPKRINVKTEDINIVMKINKEKLSVSIKSENIVPENISFLDKIRLAERLHTIGFDLEMLSLNGLQIISKSEKPLNYNKKGERDRESMRNEIIGKKASSVSDNTDFSLLL